MTEDTDNVPFDPALGAVEPHAQLLIAPPAGQILYKIMTIENLLRSASGRYLYFNRVDGYKDFPNADPHDGEQLQQDRAANATMRFEKAPDFSVADYYDRSRHRTYACCFSLENSDHIWGEYANGSARGKVGVAFDFAKLRAIVNETVKTGNGLEYQGVRCKQIFSVNYGIVEYMSWAAARGNIERMANPIRYTYIKDDNYAKEHEMRISLSALGIGRYVLADGTEMEFPPGLQLGFDFQRAIADATITEIFPGPGCDLDFLRSELGKLGVEAADRGGADGAA
ncbi:MAG TPA: hypothetical protein VNX23_05545 [Bradyrhizobium sp.]|jgi:hypothetical protein|uniref:hypothetical protein n=1 Tax=Bradyrhizobium sp. TaxID=376 RepID=UPI002C59D11D|nr:hypothetical protein [Bradyrhizobium sp.]HXB76871.1 hypothetical protein [Bradyrhizobium sp.]